MSLSDCFALQTLPTDIVSMIHRYGKYELFRGTLKWEVQLQHDRSYDLFVHYCRVYTSGITVVLCINSSQFNVYIGSKHHSTFLLPEGFYAGDVCVLDNTLYILHQRRSSKDETKISLLNLNGEIVREITISKYMCFFNIDKNGNIIGWTNSYTQMEVTCLIDIFSNDGMLIRSLQVNHRVGMINLQGVDIFVTCGDRIGSSVNFIKKYDIFGKEVHAYYGLQRLLIAPCGELIFIGFDMKFMAKTGRIINLTPPLDHAYVASASIATNGNLVVVFGDLNDGTKRTICCYR